MGGGVLEQPHLLALIRGKSLESLKGYLQVPEIIEHIEDYIVRSTLGKRSGVLGPLPLLSMRLKILEWCDLGFLPKPSLNRKGTRPTENDGKREEKHGQVELPDIHNPLGEVEDKRGHRHFDRERYASELSEDSQ